MIFGFLLQFGAENMLSAYGEKMTTFAKESEYGYVCQAELEI